MLLHSPVASGPFDNIGKAFKNVGNQIKHAANNAGNQIKHAANNAGNQIKHAANNAGNQIKKTANDAGGAVKNTANTVAKEAVKAEKVAVAGAVMAANTVAKEAVKAEKVAVAGIVMAANTVAAGVTGLANQTAGAANKLGNDIEKGLEKFTKDIEKTALEAAAKLKEITDKMCTGFTGFMDALTSALLDNPLLKFITGLMKFPMTVKNIKSSVENGTDTLTKIRIELCKDDVSKEKLIEIDKNLQKLIDQIESAGHDFTNNEVCKVMQGLDTMCGTPPTAALMMTPKLPIIPNIGLLLGTFCTKVSMEDMKIHYLTTRLENLLSYSLSAKARLADRINDMESVQKSK
jgi:hypothetical protein